MFTEYIFSEKSFKYRFKLLLVFVIALTGSANASTVEVAVNPYLGPSHFNIGAGIGIDNNTTYDNRLAQTFTPQVSGTLNSISFIAAQYHMSTANLKVSIATVSFGQPSQILASGYLTPASIPVTFGITDNLSYNSFTESLYFSANNILLNAGTQYAIIFSSNTPDANYRIYGSYSGYAGGSLMDFQNSGPYDSRGGDLYFKVTATPIVPEPATLAMLLIGGIFLRRPRT